MADATAKGGYPYVEPDDALTDYPATMQALATILEAEREVIWDSDDAAVTFPAASIGPIAIPTKFRHLEIWRECHVNVNGVQTMNLRFNGDTGNNYRWAQGNGGNFSGLGSSIPLGYVTDSDSSDGHWAAVLVGYLFDYRRTGRYRNIITTSVGGGPTPNISAIYVGWVGQWANLADPITSISILPSGGSFVDPTHITIYGRL